MNARRSPAGTKDSSFLSRQRPTECSGLATRSLSASGGLLRFTVVSPGELHVLATERLFDSLRDLIDAWKHRVQQHSVVRHRHVVDRKPVDRSVEIPESIFSDSGRDFRSETCREIVL